MIREEVIKIIENDPCLTMKQGAAILDRMEDCETHLIEEFNALVNEYGKDTTTVSIKMFKVCFIHGYVYASLELNGEVKI